MAADLSAPVPARIGAIMLAVLLHGLLLVALIRGLAPDFTAAMVREAITTFTVTAPAPAPSPVPSISDAAPPGNEGAAGRKAQPRPAQASKPMVALTTKAAPPVAGKGSENASGARDAGAGAGAGLSGSGSGAGGTGDGQGAGAASKAVKIAGDISSARDYPREGRAARRGDHVVVALSVGTDGRVKACRVVRPSRDPAADRITCELATARFRFRPATDRAGNPVESVYGWQQRWFDPRIEGQDE